MDRIFEFFRSLFGGTAPTGGGGVAQEDGGGFVDDLGDAVKNALSAALRTYLDPRATEFLGKVDEKVASIKDPDDRAAVAAAWQAFRQSLLGQLRDNAPE